jgi:hypothetical protein
LRVVRTMKEPPVHTWVEPVDENVTAGIASVHVVRHGQVYGLAVFVLVDTPAKSLNYWVKRREARTQAEARLREVIAKDHYGRLPPQGALRDVGGDGVNLGW